MSMLNFLYDRISTLTPVSTFTEGSYYPDNNNVDKRDRTEQAGTWKSISPTDTDFWMVENPTIKFHIYTESDKKKPQIKRGEKMITKEVPKKAPKVSVKTVPSL